MVTEEETHQGAQRESPTSDERIAPGGAGPETTSPPTGKRVRPVAIVIIVAILAVVVVSVAVGFEMSSAGDQENQSGLVTQTDQEGGSDKADQADSTDRQDESDKSGQSDESSAGDEQSDKGPSKVPESPSPESPSGGSATGGDGGGGSAAGSAPSAPAPSANPAPSPPPEPSATVHVTVSVSSDSVGGPVSAFQNVTLNQGASVYDALCATGVSVDARSTQYGMYVSAIGGLAEKQHGSGSGWVYTVNGSSPFQSCDGYILSDGDAVSWAYTTGGRIS